MNVKTLGQPCTPDYSLKMEIETQSRVVPAVLAGLVLSVGLAGFGGWVATGDDLFMSLIQTGMRWCF